MNTTNYINNFLETYIPFTFDTTDYYIEWAFESAYDLLKKRYAEPKFKLMASDGFGIDVVDTQTIDVVAKYSIGGLLKGKGPFAIREEITNEVIPFKLNENLWY